MDTLQIAELGHPVLRKQARPLPPETFSQYGAFFTALEKKMLYHNGVGIAAPQVGESIRAFIVASRPNPRYPNAPVMEPTLMINPEILWASADMEKDWEGCLSIPGIRALVSRHKHIEVRYFTPEGEEITTRLDGFIARIFQHELDHLNGLVFLDRADKTDYYSESEYLKRV
ncbi:peptide deformylase [Photobacterium aquae]|uniref:Peptide deformylase n=1 Tax=Photobacterium aquae TaxID=1195763 RepID=A0A0J1HD38_9GAMM|nr:peptide deformylase [Photobacterium aquae]KLV09604.1 peptide deformylase [Photobacterium aquae]